ncbi:ETC complex I subunit conserved region-domain-containing protein, partial [Phakopsora pachyrhizi]
ELNVRPVRIYRPSPTTMQSAKTTSHQWVVDWDALQGGGRWENPLMGWASSADYMQGTRLSFDSSNDAVAFCEKQGWPYYVQAPKSIKFKPKSYSDNYLYSPGKLRIHKTK